MSGSLRSLAVAVVAALALTGCTDGNRTTPAAHAEPAAPATLTSTVTGPARREVTWSTPVQVSAAAGRLNAVTLVDANGRTVGGHRTGNRWGVRGHLVPDTRYTLHAEATNRDGQVTGRTWHFRTRPAVRTDFPAVAPLAGATVGVGHPVFVYLHHPVRFKAKFEKRLHVTASRPVTGSWGWVDDRTIAYRPKRFWPGHTRVTVRLDVGKTQTAPGRWIKADRTISFLVGRSQVLRIRNATKRLTVSRDGTLVRTIPVSMGKPGFTTRSGVKVIMGRERTVFMSSDTVGIGGADAYALEVPYAMRMTVTGEFLHGAPWSEWAQGSANVSHGCTNVSLANGAWLYTHTLIGDPVVTTGTGRPTETWNGLGGIWNYSWAQWKARSAQH